MRKVYKCIMQVALVKLFLLSVGTESRFNGCDLIIQATEKSFYICTNSPGERDTWSRDFENAAAKLKPSTALSVAPIWRPDDQSGLCSRCDAQFSLLLRRHHCRNCGNIVCDNCSKDRAAIGNIEKGKPVRVCGPCKIVLSGRPSISGTSDVSARRVSALPPPPVPPPSRKPPRPSVTASAEDIIKDS